MEATQITDPATQSVNRDKEWMAAAELANDIWWEVRHLSVEALLRTSGNPGWTVDPYMKFMYIWETIKIISTITTRKHNY